MLNLRASNTVPENMDDGCDSRGKIKSHPICRLPTISKFTDFIFHSVYLKEGDDQQPTHPKLPMIPSFDSLPLRPH